MKKIRYSLLIFVLFFMFSFNVDAASNRFEVKFSDCVDGDTAKFVYKKEVITARFLAIDTPETKHPTKGVEPYGNEASNFTCDALKNASKIELEYDDDSDKKDKYDRYLVWVFVDDVLLQDELIKNGLASVAYLYGDYKYTPLLQDHEAVSEASKIGIWSDSEPVSLSYEVEDDNSGDSESIDEGLSTIITIICFAVVVILCIFNTSFRKKTINKIKKSAKKEIKKQLKEW